MSVLKSANIQDENGGKDMLKKHWGLERVWSGLGWGMFFILVGGLIFASNKGWLPGNEWWLYFAVGTGAIFVIEFLVRFFTDEANRWGGLGSLVVGISLVYIGMAFLYGFGDWWPLVFVPVGVGYIVRGIMHSRKRPYVL